jgi:hypothetical protein
VKKIRKPDKLYAISDIFTKRKDMIKSTHLESYLDNRRYLT